MMTQQRSEQQETLGSSQKLNIDWQQVCQAIWKNSLFINPLTTQPKETEAAWEEIHLSLGLVEPHQHQYRRGYSFLGTEQQADTLSQEELIQKYSQKEFCEQVLSLGKSKTGGKRLAIIGESSTGKTTILNQIVTWILENTNDLPIWISMAEIGETSVREYLEQKWLKRIAKIQDELTRHWQNSLEELLNSGRVWLLLDGVEQMPLKQLEKLPLTLNSLKKPQMLLDPLSATIQQLEGWADQTRVIITSRSEVWEANQKALLNFDIFRPLALTYPEQVKQFINHWFSHNSRSEIDSHSSTQEEQDCQETSVFSDSMTELAEDFSRPEKLVAQLFQSLNQLGYEQLKTLIKTPLQVSFLCREAQQHKGNLPKTVAQICKQLVGQYYQWQGENLPRNKQEKLTQMLGKVAIQALQQPKHLSWVYHHQITQEIGEDDSLLKLALRLGWLTVIGLTANEYRETVYRFWDETFQAYFAATAIENWQFFINHPLGNISSLSSTQSESSYRIFESQWQPVILLWLGREDVKKEDKEAFLKSLVEFSDGCETDNFYGKKAYFLAASGLAVFPESQQANEILLQLLQWSFFDAQMSPLITQAAKATLIKTHQQWTISALIQLLTTIKNETIKREIFKTLEKIGGGNPQLVATFTEILSENPSNSLGWQVAESLGKIDPGNNQAIATILNLLLTAEKEEKRQIAFNSLEKIGKGNFKAIITLIQLLQTTDSPTTTKRVFETIETIGYGNGIAIAALVQLIRTNGNERIRRQAAESLEKIDPGNPTAINVLVQFVNKASTEEIQKEAVYSIGEITPGNLDAINALVKILSPKHDLFLRWMAISSLSKIALGNSQAISTLVNLIKSKEEKLLHKDAIESLGKIDPHNGEAITALVRLIELSNDESIRREAADSLGAIDPGNPEAITALIQLLHTTEDQFTLRQAAYSLGKLEPSNLEATKTLIQLIQSSTDSDVRSLAAESLGDVGSKNPAALAALIRLTKTTTDAKILRRAAVSLGKIGRGNREVISALIQIVKSAQEESCRLQAADSLINLLKPEQMSEVVTRLKEKLSNQQTRKDLACQKIIWHCAQQLSYPDFYQAWHNRPLYGTQKINIAETKRDELTISSSPKPQDLKLTAHHLSQLLQAKIEEHFQLNPKVHLIFIDSNDLIDPENPFVDIYDSMLAQNCPEFKSGIPDTMAKLRLYWNTIVRDDKNQLFVLVFYENLTQQDYQGFSPVFLNMLNKFTGLICLVTKQKSETLQHFFPNEPELIEKMINWIKTQT